MKVCQTIFSGAGTYTESGKALHRKIGLAHATNYMLDPQPKPDQVHRSRPDNHGGIMLPI